MAGSSYQSSPDQVSPYYPERFIRPLPKRTIRSRLSEEVAEKIAYPPNPPTANLPTYGHYDYEHDNDSFQDEDEGGHDSDCPHHPHHHHHHHCHHHDHEHDHEHEHDHDEEEDELESADDASPIAQRTAGYRSSPRSPQGRRHGRNNSYDGKSPSALDGYEAFENTNNKKKRKIPTSGSLSLHPGSMTSDFPHGEVLSREPSADETAGYPSSSGLGVQGAGRGRTGRKSNVRNPLGPSLNGSNTRGGSVRYDQSMMNGDGSVSDQGIISKAIANATTLLRNPLRKDQENIGVLDQQTKTTPTNSQFTFTCESADSKGVKFPEQSLYSPDYAHRIVDSGSSTSPLMQTQRYSSQVAQTGQYGNNIPPPQPPLPLQPNNVNAQGPPPKPRPRRRKGDVYALAARQRKLQQEYANLQHPPSHEDVWICEFCEYESIFGSQPHALIRQYEIKDRREQKRLAEKRRLLEKAKLKGRKGKKQTKNAAKAANAAAAQQPMNNQNYDDQSLDQMDDYLDDGYDDDPIPMPAPPLQAPIKQPIPGSYDRGGGGGGRTGSESAGIAGGGIGAGEMIR